MIELAVSIGRKASVFNARANSIDQCHFVHGVRWCIISFKWLDIWFHSIYTLRCDNQLLDIFHCIIAFCIRNLHEQKRYWPMKKTKLPFITQLSDQCKTFGRFRHFNLGIRTEAVVMKNDLSPIIIELVGKIFRGNFTSNNKKTNATFSAQFETIRVKITTGYWHLFKWYGGWTIEHGNVSAFSSFGGDDRPPVIFV